MDKDIFQKVVDVINDSAPPLKKQHETDDALLDNIGDEKVFS